MGIETILMAASVGSQIYSATQAGKGGDRGVQQASALTPDAKKFYDQIIGLAAPGVGQPLPSYPGDRLAPRNPLESLPGQFYQGAAGDAMGMSGILGDVMQGYDPNQAWNFLNQAQAPMDRMLAEYDPAAAKQAWQKGVLDPGMNAWEDMQRQITESMGQRNMGSSGYLDTALAESGGDLMSGILGQLAQMQYSGEQAQLGRNQAGINQLMNLVAKPGQIVGQGAGVQGIGASILGQAAGVGQQDRAYEQNIINNLMQKWQEEQGPNWMQLAPMILGTQAAESYYQPPSPGVGSVLGPALGSLLGSQGFQSLLMGKDGGGTTSPPPQPGSSVLGGRLQYAPPSSPFLYDYGNTWGGTPPVGEWGAGSSSWNF